MNSRLFSISNCRSLPGFRQIMTKGDGTLRTLRGTFATFAVNGFQLSLNKKKYCRFLSIRLNLGPTERRKFKEKDVYEIQKFWQA